MVAGCASLQPPYNARRLRPEVPAATLGQHLPSKRQAMSITVAVVAQGSMGSGVGKRLHKSGAEVRTLLSGRSAASAERAGAAGMKPAADEKALLQGADFFLSILPPGEAENLARQLAPALSALAKKPIYVDCNAISPQTAERVAAIVETTGARFVDGRIIGGPPSDGCNGPATYA